MPDKNSRRWTFSLQAPTTFFGLQKKLLEFQGRTNSAGATITSIDSIVSLPWKQSMYFLGTAVNILRPQNWDPLALHYLTVQNIQTE